MGTTTGYKGFDAVTAAACALAVAAGIAVGFYLGPANGVFTVLIASGAYLALSFALKERKERDEGPSELGAAVTGGVLLAGIGICGFVYSFTEEVPVTVVCLIAVMVLSAAILFIRYRRYLRGHSMKPLFTIDMEDYDESDPVKVEPASRGIIWKNDKLALIRSVKYGYYKFPGGGVEDGESLTDALIREVREESGLEVIPESIRLYGMSKRFEKGIWDYVLDQDSYYYLCDVTDRTFPQELGRHEMDAKFILEYIGPGDAVKANERFLRKEQKVAIDRDSRVLRMLMTEMAARERLYRQFISMYHERFSRLRHDDPGLPEGRGHVQGHHIPHPGSRGLQDGRRRARRGAEGT